MDQFSSNLADFFDADNDCGLEFEQGDNEFAFDEYNNIDDYPFTETFPINDSASCQENSLMLNEPPIPASTKISRENFLEFRIKNRKRLVKQINDFDFNKTNAGIWMNKIFGKKIPKKKQLLIILKSLQIPWNDNHETQYLWRKVKNSNKISYRDIYRNKNCLLDYLSRVWENKNYQKLLENALLELVKDSKSTK